MNIAILTQPICNNYGGIIQNYALQTVLERMGNSVTTLNNPVVPGKYGSRIRLFLSVMRRLLWKISGKPGIVWINPEIQGFKEIDLAQLQKRFIDEYLHIVNVEIPLTRDQVIDRNFEAFVVGSDQVWRPRYNKCIENMFLDFTESMNVKRIAYAASFGSDNWEITSGQTSRCFELAKRFEAISVRESGGVKLCKEYLGVDAFHVLDPTLLLEASDYLELCGGCEHPSGDYIAVYILDYSKKRMQFLRRISKELKLPIHFVGRFTKSGFPSVESWLEGIANAKYVITDSFHGTVFSIIFQKQFLTIQNLVRGVDRFKSLLELLGLEDRLISDNGFEILGNEIDYSKVNTILNREREESMKFLRDNLV